MTSSQFQFLGFKIDAARFKSLAKNVTIISGPIIQVNKRDMVVDSVLTVDGLMQPIVVCHENKYHVLASKQRPDLDAIGGEEVTVKLITKPALKKFVIN